MKTYIGDSVYADFERGMIKLTTENGYGPTNTIYLEIEVLDSLVKFVNQISEQNNGQDILVWKKRGDE